MTLFSNTTTADAPSANAPHEHPRRARRRAVFAAVRVAVGVGLIALVVLLNKPRDIAAQLLTASVPNLAGALALYLAATFIVARRWQLVLAARGHRESLIVLTRLYLLGFFFNNFIPSSVGGDVIRVTHLAQRGCNLALSFGSVFVERLIGFLAMAALALGSMVYLATLFAEYPMVLVGTVALALAFLGIAVVCFDRRGLRLVTAVLTRLRWKGLAAKLQAGFDAVHAFRDHPAMLMRVFLLSLVYQAAMGAFTYWVVRATGLSAPFMQIFALMQVASMVGVMPLTVENAGIREWVFKLALGPAVVSPILMVRIVSLAGSLVGGALFLRGERTTSACEVQT